VNARLHEELESPGLGGGPFYFILKEKKRKQDQLWVDAGRASIEGEFGRAMRRLLIGIDTVYSGRRMMRGKIKYTSAGRAAREPDLVLRYPPQPGPRAVPARGGRLRLFRVYSSLPTANRLS
jgi:hypothetical protein